MDFMLASIWHIHQASHSSRVIQQVDTGLTFIDARLSYDPYALELLRRSADGSELADLWNTMAVAWAAIVVAQNVSRCPWRADAIHLRFPGDDLNDRFKALYEDAPPLLVTERHDSEIWLYDL
jgi:hypothetical protein